MAEQVIWFGMDIQGFKVKCDGPGCNKYIHTRGKGRVGSIFGQKGSKNYMRYCDDCAKKYKVGRHRSYK